MGTRWRRIRILKSCKFDCDFDLFVCLAQKKEIAPLLVLQMRALLRRILKPQQLRILFYFWIRSKSIASKTCYGQKKPKISSEMFCLMQQTTPMKALATF